MRQEISALPETERGAKQAELSTAQGVRAVPSRLRSPHCPGRMRPPGPAPALSPCPVPLSRPPAPSPCSVPLGPVLLPCLQLSPTQSLLRQAGAACTLAGRGWISSLAD